MRPPGNERHVTWGRWVQRATATTGTHAKCCSSTAAYSETAYGMYQKMRHNLYSLLREWQYYFDLLSSEGD
jgi:hypothetical protein